MLYVCESSVKHLFNNNKNSTLIKLGSQSLTIFSNQMSLEQLFFFFSFFNSKLIGSWTVVQHEKHVNSWSNRENQKTYLTKLSRLSRQSKSSNLKLKFEQWNREPTQRKCLPQSLSLHSFHLYSMVQYKDGPTADKSINDSLNIRNIKL